MKTCTGCLIRTCGSFPMHNHDCAIMANKKGINVTIKDLKSRLDIFIKCSVINPAFNSQSKEKLTSPRIQIDPITDGQIKKIMQWDFVTDLKRLEEFKHKKSK